MDRCYRFARYLGMISIDLRRLSAVLHEPLDEEPETSKTKASERKRPKRKPVRKQREPTCERVVITRKGDLHREPQEVRKTGTLFQLDLDEEERKTVAQAPAVAQKPPSSRRRTSKRSHKEKPAPDTEPEESKPLQIIAEHPGV